MPSRRKVLAASSIGVASAIGSVLFTGLSGRKWRLNSTSHSPITEGATVTLEPMAQGMKQPLALENPIENYHYIADKFGKIHLHTDEELKDEIVLDIRDKLSLNHGEQGLLGLEFHPDFENNRLFYVRYSSPPRDGTPNGYSHTFVLAEFRMTDDYRKAIPTSERPILEIPEPGEMHNAGAIEFGPDGYLYVTVGDGGGDGHDGSGPLNLGSDSHSGDWYWLNVGGNGQDVTKNLLGSVLRIDINERGEAEPYSIPKGNPLLGRSGMEEHFAWGFRNPYSMSFDDEDLYVSDAATKLYEEVNLVEKGGNYGWNVKEGTSCHNNFPPLRAFSLIDFDVRTLPACPNATPGGSRLMDPVISYPGELGAVVIGGQMYRATTISKLQNKYVFGDLVGKLFSSSPSSKDSLWPVEELLVKKRGESEASKYIGDPLLSIEKGRDGELFALTAGTVYRVLP